MSYKLIADIIKEALTSPEKIALRHQSISSDIVLMLKMNEDDDAYGYMFNEDDDAYGYMFKRYWLQRH